MLVYEVFKEYGMKVSESKSNVVCMNGEVGKRLWKIGDGVLEETDNYKYLGVVAIGGINGVFRSLGERMKDARGVIGMVKYAAKRSVSRFVVGREG